MHDRQLVCSRKPRRDLACDAYDLGHRHHALAVQPRGQAFAVQAFHHDVRLVVAGGVVVDDLDDVRVRELTDDFRLALEARQSCGIREEQHLHRDTAMQPEVLGVQHHAHSAVVEYLQDAIGIAKYLSHHVRRCGQGTGQLQRVPHRCLARIQTTLDPGNRNCR